EAGKSEEVVDEAAESFALAGDGCFEAVGLGPSGLFAQEGLDACLECGDRGAGFVGGVREEAAGCGVAGARLLDRCLESVDHLIERLGEAPQLGVGAGRIESKLRIATGYASRGLDDRGQGTKGSPGALEDEEGGERQRGGRDEELDEQEVVDGVVDACAAGAEGDLGPVGENLVEDEQWSARPDRRGLRRYARRSRRRGRRRDTDGDPFEREAR